MCVSIEKPRTRSIIVDIAELIDNVLDNNPSSMFASLIFYEALKSFNIDCEIVDGYIVSPINNYARCHMWIEYEDHIYDIYGSSVEDYELYEQVIVDNIPIINYCEFAKIELDRYFRDSETFWNSYPTYDNVRRYILRTIKNLC